VSAPASQSFADHVQAARRGLIDATKRAGLERDRYADLIAAQDAVVGLYPEFLAEMERLRQPVQDRQLRNAVITGVQECTTDIIRHNTLRTAAIAAGVAVVWSAALIGGTWWYCHSDLTASVAGIEQQLTGPEAAGWLTILQNNHLAVAKHGATCWTQDQHTACSLPLWMDPPPPSPSPTQP
jgi:hypothetical protein